MNTLLQDTDQCQSNSCLSPCPVAGSRSCPAGSLCSSPSAVPSADDPEYWLQAGLICAYLQSSPHHEELWQSLKTNKQNQNNSNSKHLTFENTQSPVIQAGLPVPCFQGSLCFLSVWLAIKVFLHTPGTAGDQTSNWQQDSRDLAWCRVQKQGFILYHAQCGSGTHLQVLWFMIRPSFSICLSF